MNLPADSASSPAGSAPAPRLETLQDLYDRGLYLQAWRQGAAWGELQDWPGVEPRLLAARLCHQLGSPRLGEWLIRGLKRSAPEHPEVQYYHLYSYWRRRGPYAAWRYYQTHPPLAESATADTRSAWLCMAGQAAGMLRDFDVAEGLLQQARDVAPDSAWVRVCTAGVLEQQDEYDAAFREVHSALELRPWYRPAVEYLSHLHTLRGEDEQAVSLLEEAAQRLECAGISAQLYGIYMELKQYGQARAALERFFELSPLIGKKSGKWLAGARAELAYREGDYEEAIAQAELSDSDFQKGCAERLRNPEHRAAKVVQLPVGFVRQHHATCAPATLSAISRFWQMPADHLQVAEEICYDGTSNHSERVWAETHGWVTREFSVTEESAVALLDRGVPFTFTTVDPGNAHLQAVIGYDARRGLLTLRDPFFRSSGDALAEKMLARYRPYGPRGMALVPAERRELLENLDLPDAAVWDVLHQFDGALKAHRRDDAAQCVEQLAQDYPQHRLALEARRRLAIYDNNPQVQLQCVEQLLAQFPDCQALQFERLALLRSQGQRDDRLQTLHKLCNQKDAHPLFWQQYAQELRVDARRQDDALYLARRAIRRWQSDSSGYTLLAGLYADEQRLEEAVELYRFAACLADKDEQSAQAYFQASGWIKQTDRALDFLRSRFSRFGAKSSAPARSLATAYSLLDRYPEALETIDQALLQRPDDGSLLLFAADYWGNAGAQHAGKARELLERARDKAPRGEWLRSAARIADREGRLEEALAAWQEALALAPLAMDAHQALAQLYAETAGESAALAFLRERVELFPHHSPLCELWLQWEQDQPAEEREPKLRLAISRFPENAWLHRELLHLLRTEQRLDEAWKESALAAELEPLSPSLAIARAMLFYESGDLAAARNELTTDLARSIDNDYSIRLLLEYCPTPSDRRAALAFLQEQLTRQTIVGDSLLAFREVARGVLPPEELLQTLRAGLAARPDLWLAWSALIQQLAVAEQLDEAADLALRATERFPMVARLWIDLAKIRLAQLDDEAELAALRTAQQLAPNWSFAIRSLADALLRQGDAPGAKELLAGAVARNPLDVALLQELAEVLWGLEQREEALACAEKAVQLEPGFERSWDALNSWSERLGKPELALASARRLAQRRGGESRSWLILARMLDEPEQREERLAAVDKAIALSHRHTDAHDLRAVTLAQAERWEEAQAACRPAVYGEHVPSELLARAAWIEAQRGDYAAAIAQMEQVVADEPGFYGAWTRLADWRQQLGDHEGYLKAAQAMAALDPHNEVNLGYLGEALLQTGDKSAARAAFSKAFELNPRYEFGGNYLFDLQLEAGDLTAAAATLAQLRAHSSSPWVMGRQARLAAQLPDPAAATEALCSIAVNPDGNEWALLTAIEADSKLQGALATERCLEERLTAERTHPNLIEQWVRLRMERGSYDLFPVLQPLLDREAGRTAFSAFVESLVRGGKRAEFNRLVEEHRALFRENDFLWGSVAFGLAASRNYSATASWCADWAVRDEAQPWMLANAVEGFRNVGQWEQAVACGRHAITLPQVNGQFIHRLWLAYDAAAEGRLDEAEEHWRAYAGVKPETLDDDNQFLELLASARLELLRSAPPSQAAVGAAQRKKLVAFLKGYSAIAQEPARKQAYSATLQRLAAARGWWGAVVQAWDQLLGQA